MKGNNSQRVACFRCKNIRPNDFAGEHCAVDGRQVALLFQHYCGNYVEMEPSKHDIAEELE